MRFGGSTSSPEAGSLALPDSMDYELRNEFACANPRGCVAGRCVEVPRAMPRLVAATSWRRNITQPNAGGGAGRSSRLKPRAHTIS